MVLAGPSSRAREENKKKKKPQFRGDTGKMPRKGSGQAQERQSA